MKKIHIPYVIDRVPLDSSLIPPICEGCGLPKKKYSDERYRCRACLNKARAQSIQVRVRLEEALARQGEPPKFGDHSSCDREEAMCDWCREIYREVAAESVVA